MLRSCLSLSRLCPIRNNYRENAGLFKYLFGQFGRHGFVTAASFGIVAMLGFGTQTNDANAGSRVVSFKHNNNISGKRISGYRSYRHGKSGHYRSTRRAFKHKRGKYNAYRGPLIINVPGAIGAHRNHHDRDTLYILDNNSWLKRHEIKNGGVLGSSRPRAIYYDDKECNSGKTCIIRMGPNRRSPKLIVVGEREYRGNQPHIIRVPR